MLCLVVSTPRCGPIKRDWASVETICWWHVSEKVNKITLIRASCPAGFKGFVPLNNVYSHNVSPHTPPVRKKGNLPGHKQQAWACLCVWMRWPPAVRHSSPPPANSTTSLWAHFCPQMENLSSRQTVAQKQRLSVHNYYFECLWKWRKLTFLAKDVKGENSFLLGSPLWALFVLQDNSKKIRQEWSSWRIFALPSEWRKKPVSIRGNAESDFLSELYVHSKDDLFEYAMSEKVLCNFTFCFDSAGQCFLSLLLLFHAMYLWPYQWNIFLTPFFPLCKVANPSHQKLFVYSHTYL